MDGGTLDGLTDHEKLSLHFIGVMHSLAEQGLLAAGADAWAMTPKGTAAYDQLLASGYCPDDTAVRRLILERLLRSDDEQHKVGLAMAAVEAAFAYFEALVANRRDRAAGRPTTPMATIREAAFRAVAEAWAAIENG